MAWWRELPLELWGLLRGIPAVVRERRWLWLAWALCGGLAAAVLIPGDVARSQAWFVPQAPALRDLSAALGTWGRLDRAPLALLVAVWLVGAWRGRRHWRRAALAALLAGALAGLVASTVKGLGGRPRPLKTLRVDASSVPIEDRFTGPSAQHDFQSFPSGHATHCTAVAVALVVTLPPVGVPALVGAGVVSWSRMYFHRHYLGDVAAGTALGGLVGLWFGSAARRRTRAESTAI